MGIILYNFTSYQVCITICILLFFICFLLLFKVKNEKIVLKQTNIIKEIFKVESAKDYIKYSCSSHRLTGHLSGQAQTPQPSG